MKLSSRVPLSFRAVWLAALLPFVGACSAADDGGSGSNDANATTNPQPGPVPPPPGPGEPNPSVSPSPSVSGAPVDGDPDDFFDVPDDPNSGLEGGFLPSEKVDLVLVIDNSLSMGDKQQIFKAAIPDLIDQMVNPPCVHKDTQEFVRFPEGELSCPLDHTRIFAPVTDIHIGVLSSSLGARGAQGVEVPPGCRDDVEGENDKSWLLGRSRAALTPQTYQGMGFLVWDPKQAAVPPGDPDLNTLIAKFNSQIDTVGESGCGFEAPLEAAYRFLSEPDPYETLQRVACPGREGTDCVELAGVDQDLLAQRAAFLRPDSVVVVMYLTDENDCSIRPKGQGYRALMLNQKLNNGTAACNLNPNDECCLPCGATLPAQCDSNPDTNGCAEQSNDIVEARTLRCFDQKRRFGVNYLRSTDIYVAGFVNPIVADRNNQGQPNALFTSQRGRDKIFVVGILGIPWQNTATAETLQPNDQGRFDLIEAQDVDWAKYLPVNGAPPTDPFNIEAMGMRSGAHPLTQEALAGPGTWNSINGHERELYLGDRLSDDLQYSCIFPLIEPRDCSTEATYGSCDCVVETDSSNNTYNYFEGNPLCRNPETGAYGQTQYYAKAYPGTRLLEVLKGVSCPPDLPAGAKCTDQAVVSSICPRQVTDPTKQDFGYRPVIRALLLNVAAGIAR